VEEKIDIDREFFLSFAIDDAARAPMIIFAIGGGTGIEERAAATRRIPCDVNRGPLDSGVDEAVASCELSAKNAKQLNESLRKLFAAARSVEARSLEINPLVVTKAASSWPPIAGLRLMIIQVVRHPELGIEIAREFDHPPTALERVAYAVEQNDHRGTFYFAQLGDCGSGGIKGLGGISRRWRWRLDDVDGRDREYRVYDRQFHGHERQSIRVKSVSRGANHSGPTRSGGLFRFRLRRLRARNNIGLRTGWRRRFGNSISTSPQ
jgi:hypothetical protein